METQLQNLDPGQVLVRAQVSHMTGESSRYLVVVDFRVSRNHDPLLNPGFRRASF